MASAAIPSRSTGGFGVALGLSNWLKAEARVLAKIVKPHFISKHEVTQFKRHHALLTCGPTYCWYRFSCPCSPRVTSHPYT